MNRRTWTGLLVGLLAVLGVLIVGGGAYHAGERHHETVTAVGPGSTLATPDGTVRVVGIDHWRGGPPFGFLFPLLFIGLIVLLVTGRRRAYWGRPWGPGPYGGFDEWHRHAHEQHAAP
ncbi:MAG TPA: hypothetical protein VHL53_08460, partial [Acidimicrobiia bacterium]|nr:hypothetical protein [Acidimicrobiia bacterium]